MFKHATAFFAPALLAIGLWGEPLSAAGLPDRQPKPHHAQCMAATLEGQVTGFSYNSKGDLHGVWLDAEIHVRFPPHEGWRVSEVLSVGSYIEVTGCWRGGPEGDAHLKAETITVPEAGQTLTIHKRGPRSARHPRPTPEYGRPAPVAPGHEHLAPPAPAPRHGRPDLRPPRHERPAPPAPKRQHPAPYTPGYERPAPPQP